MLLSWLPLSCPLSLLLLCLPASSQPLQSSAQLCCGWILPGESQSFSTEFPSECVCSKLGLSPCCDRPRPWQAHRMYLHCRVLRGPCSSAGTIHVPMSQSRVIPWAQLPVGHKPGDVPAEPSGSSASPAPMPGVPSSEHSCSPQQHSDSDSEPEFSSLSPSIPSAIPVTGESYCNCENQSEAPYCSSLHALHRVRDCRCGEEDEYFDWVWDELNKSTATLLTCDNRKVNFHMEYSCGTAAIRGNKELAEGQHFWEIKMTSPVYGTDMMVGIGTSDVNLDKYRHTFCSLLGKDEDSWGLSYTGLLHHKGDKTNFSSRFGQGSIIGVHLDTWHGTLTFFKNRKCIGVAATKLQNKKFYPMVCSTAAKSSMKVIRSCASRTSLQYLCCFRLRQLLPDYVDTLEVLPLPPGLKQVLHNKLGWVLSMNYSTSKPSSSSSSGSDSDSSCGSDAEACQRKRCRRT